MVDDRVAHLERTVAQLEGALSSAHRRIAALEDGSGRTRRAAWSTRASWLIGGCALAAVATLGLSTASAATAPQPLTVSQLRVVDGTGAVQVLLDARGLQVYGPHGQKVEAAVVVEPRLGGQVSTYDLQGTKTSTLGTDQNGLPAVQVWSPKQLRPQAGLLVSAAGSGRVQASGELEIDGPQDSLARLGADGNNLSLRFYQPDEDSYDVLASIGESPTTSPTSGGLVTVSRVKGIPQVLLTGGDPGGTVQTFDAGGNKAVVLAGLPSGGQLSLSNPAGTDRVVAGVNTGDLGFVRAGGPTGFNIITGK
jgi:hypothetical protein